MMMVMDENMKMVDSIMMVTMVEIMDTMMILMVFASSAAVTSSSHHHHHLIIIIIIILVIKNKIEVFNIINK
jgi:hypothetical protein